MSIQQLSDRLSEVGATKFPPVHLWQPTEVGEVDIVIRADGSWLHEGVIIQRERLVRLLASVLWLEEGEHYLKTPHEKMKIQVEEAPFFITDLDVVNPATDTQQLVFTSSYDDVVIAGKENPLWVEEKANGEPSPYLGMRYGMRGKLSRNVFYQLAEHVDQETFLIRSQHEDFVLA